jgi:hypothetical protein
MIMTFMTMAVVGPSDTLRDRVPADLKHIKWMQVDPRFADGGGGGIVCCMIYLMEDATCEIYQ